MNALVTGGAGFIGSNVVKYLLCNNWKVRVIDNLSSGHIINLQNLDVEFINGNICDLNVTENICENIDVVFHLAASVGRQKSLDNPQLDSQVNLLGTVNILESMRKYNVPKIVYSSSAAIFGELTSVSIDENHPQNADSPYGVSKLAAEKMILSYSQIYGITSVAFRYFNIFGINQRYDLYGNVIPIFAEQLYSSKKVTIYGDGEQTRDFLNVTDVVKANYLAATIAKKTDVYNLGSGNSITINELIKMMQEISGIKTEIIHAPERPADVKHCKADISKISEELNFVPSVKLYDGLCEYLKWFENMRKNHGYSL